MRIPQVFKTKNILLLITFNPLHPSHHKLNCPFILKKDKNKIFCQLQCTPLASRGCNLDFSVSDGQVDLIIRQ